MEFLIEKVRSHPCLWNVNEITFRDLSKKDLAWEQIARECGLSDGKEAKYMWKKLQNSHREALRRRKTSTGQGAQHLKPWKYEALMEFILPQNSCTPQDSYRDTQNTSDTDITEFTPPSPENNQPSSEPMNRNRRKLNSNFTKRRDQRQMDRDIIRRKIDNRSPPDALSNLFASLCQKTKELPKYLQLRVQREIFEAVTRAEEEALVEPKCENILGTLYPI